MYIFFDIIPFFLTCHPFSINFCEWWKMLKQDVCNKMCLPHFAIGLQLNMKYHIHGSSSLIPILIPFILCIRQSVSITTITLWKVFAADKLSERSFVVSTAGFDWCSEFWKRILVCISLKTYEHIMKFGDDTLLSLPCHVNTCLNGDLVWIRPHTMGMKIRLFALDIAYLL